MWLRISHDEVSTLSTPTERSLIRAIASDIHFWIPLCVLLAGIILLDKLR